MHATKAVTFALAAVALGATHEAIAAEKWLKCTLTESGPALARGYQPQRPYDQYFVFDDGNRTFNEYARGALWPCDNVRVNKEEIHARCFPRGRTDYVTIDRFEGTIQIVKFPYVAESYPLEKGMFERGSCTPSPPVTLAPKIP